MQHSLPTTSTFEGGIRSIIDDGKTGFLVPQKDAKALAEKLELLMNNPELRKKMGEAGRAKYEQEFTLKEFEKRLKEILTKITAE
jgi:glycosyltransferase involved in cell wall biosynthesis